MTNHLEQLIGEWYEFQGYFVRRNVNVGKRAKGGWEGELDIVAFHPETKHLVQIEPSMDAASWATREKRYKKKFAAGRKYIPSLFAGITIPAEIEQVAVFVFGATEAYPEIGGGTVRHIKDYLAEIVEDMQQRSVSKSVVPQQFPLLRTIQFVTHYRRDLWGGANGNA